ncbi:glycoside hydrolase family 97 protein [Chitinophaga pendula]|nr:alpha-glucosidase [Chitinophaga sp. MD30]UCJ10373.1 glycoside hydrolase family 97 protein [Chitinophaga pendula]
MSSNKSISKLFLILCGACTISSAHSQQKDTAEASLAQVKLQFALDAAGRPTYTVSYQRTPLIVPSAMGFVLAEDSTFYKGFVLTGTDRRSVDERWQPVWGEVKDIRNHYEQLTIHLRQASSGRLLDIVFRVFEDGVGFRYEFPTQEQLKYFIVRDELTQFNQTGDHTAWWIPGDYDTNEYPYTTNTLSQVDNRELVKNSTDIAVRTAPDPHAVQTPLLLKTRQPLYINIHEAALINYPAMQLHVDGASYGLSARLVPDATGNKAYLHAPCHTPWRTVLVSNKAVDLLASKTILNLNEPPAEQDFSWIKPMKFVGVWWEMQTGKSTWNYTDDAAAFATGKAQPNGRHGATTTNVKRYIDFAAANGIHAVLAEGWNIGWEDWFGNWKEEVFDFVTPYPDFDVAGLQNYAHSKGVQLIMHNETSGAVTNYERQLDTAFRFMQAYGYPAVKTGYVGRIIPRGEHHDGQWMVNHYERVAKKGLQYHVAIDAHEPPRPTGLHRTYPNWMASEAGRGNEYNAFSNGNAPEHETILPFTRLMGGPMDYTPGIFKLRQYAPHAPERQVHTTLAKQLALYVTIYSPIQMVADLPEHYAAHPDAFQFIRDVPVDWDDTRIIAAEPGDYITIARKGKGSTNWYIGAITDEQSRTVSIPLNFLDKGKKYEATIYADAPDADWKSNPEAYKISRSTVTAATILSVRLAAGGGAAITIRPL